MSDALTIRDLYKQYPNGFKALNGIDLSVEQGEFFALLGANGAGKSTTISIISSLLRKTSGEVSIFGHSLDQSPDLAKQHLGVVPQEFNFGHFEKVFDILVTQAGYYGISRKVAEQRAEEYLIKLGLWDKSETQSRMLSGGMKRRLMIARAMIHQPKLLILDEPTAGVDVELRHLMWEFLRELNRAGTTIILTTHYLEEAETLCRRVAVIDQGEIKQNSSMRDFVGQLNAETLIFDLISPVEIPAIEIWGVEMNLVEENTLEVTLDKSYALNDLFSLFESLGIQVRSMRNKNNRLEQVFINMIEKPNAGV